MASFSNELLYSLTVQGASPASHGGFSWIVDLLAFRAPVGDRDAFFLKLTRWHRELLVHKDDYPLVLKGVLLEGKSRSNLDEVGGELCQAATHIQRIEEAYEGKSPGERLKEWGQTFTWDEALAVRDVGFIYSRLQRVEKGSRSLLPLASLGALVQGRKTDDKKLSQWATAINIWLTQSRDPLAFDLLHRVLMDLIEVIETQDRAVALGQLYQRLQERYKLTVQGCSSSSQQRWIRALQFKEVVGDSGYILGEKMSATRHRLHSKKEHFLEADPNPARLLMKMAMRAPRAADFPFAKIATSVSYIDPGGRFAIVEDEGTSACKKTTGNDKQWVALFKNIVECGLQPKGVDWKRQVRVVASVLYRLFVQSVETEELDVVKLESFFRYMVRAWSKRGKRLVRQRRWMQETGLSRHALADKARARALQAKKQQLDEIVNVAVDDLVRDYKVQGVEAKVRQQLAPCLRNDAYAIALIPSDFADLLVDHVVVTFSLKKKG